MKAPWRVAVLLAALAVAIVSRAWGAAPAVRTLENGLTVAVLRDSRLPIVQIQILVPAGTAQESDREHGAAPLVASLLTRGTTSRSADGFTAEVDDLGATISAEAGVEYATLGATFLSRDFEHAIELVADAVRNPIFDEHEVARAREQAMHALYMSRRMGDVIADEHLWGSALRGHPYGVPRLPGFESLAELSRADLQEFHRECYRPDRALVAISGDVDPVRAFAAVSEQFASWKGRARPWTTTPPAPLPGFHIRLVDVPGATAAVIRLGLLGPARNSPEAYPLMVANDLLGAGPVSRLGAGHGARAPQAYSSIHLFHDFGLVVLGTTAPGDSVGFAAARLRSELGRFVRQPPGDDEVARSRRSIGRGFSVDNDGAGLQATQWLGARFQGLGDDYPDRFPGRVQAVTAADVRACAQRWFDPDHAQLVVVGDASRLEAQLKPLGPVEVVPLSAPPVELLAAPEFRMSPPTADQLRRGRELAGQVVAAHGGLAKLQRVKDSVVESQLTLISGERTASGRQKEMRRDPWQLRIETAFTQMVAVQALDGEHGWNQTTARGDSVADEDSSGVAALRGLFEADLIHVLQTAADSLARVSYRGEDEIGGRPVDVLEVIAPGGRRWVLFVERETHRLAALEENSGSALGGPALRRIFSDLREEQGILWPHFERRLLDGESVMTLKTESVRWNTGLPAAAFEKPGTKPAAPVRPRGR